MAKKPDNTGKHIKNRDSSVLAPDVAPPDVAPDAPQSVSCPECDQPMRSVNGIFRCDINHQSSPIVTNQNPTPTHDTHQSTQPAPPVPPATPSDARPETRTDATRTGRIDVPLLRTSAYVTRNLATLKISHAQTLRDAADGLIAEQATLESGKPIKGPADALTWILEQLAKTAAT